MGTDLVKRQKDDAARGGELGLPVPSAVYTADGFGAAASVSLSQQRNHNEGVRQQRGTSSKERIRAAVYTAVHQASRERIFCADQP